MPRNPNRPLDFAVKVRDIYRECAKGNDNREIRHHYCKDCGNIEHHMSVSEKDVGVNHSTGETCINCCAIFEDAELKQAERLRR